MKNPFTLSAVIFVLILSSSTSFLINNAPCKKQTSVVALREVSPENRYATRSEKFNAKWNVMFARLKEYKEDYGDCLVPQKYAEDPKLGRWVATQRAFSTVDDTAKEERRDKLDSIGFVWRVRDAGSLKQDKKWNDKFERLVQYKQEHGDCLVPQHYTEYKEDKKLPSLGKWVSRQRALYANNKLRSDRRSKLESIGFVWVAGETLTAYEKQWEEMFAKLKRYHRENGDCLIPAEYEDDPSLGVWVTTQRSRRNNLDSERTSRLESIGFVWDALDHQWEEMFAKLELYFRKRGDCLVPVEYNDDPPLGMWVARQRHGREGLDSDRTSRLESIGFVWNALDHQWEEMFNKLDEYYRKRGDCLVPVEYEEDPSLGIWVGNMRRRREGLDSDRISRLESIGFVWDALDIQWEDMFTKLEAYYKKHGDCVVPVEYHDDPSLGMWVSTQRQRRDEMDSTRRKRLESIGFVWSPLDQQWEEMFVKLEEYRQLHGGCLVPRSYKEDPPLGQWVSNMRSRREGLDPIRRERLESIGFVWRASSRP